MITQGLRGIDVSKWQGDIDWKTVALSDIAFAYVKCSEGQGYRDPKFRRNMLQSREGAPEILIGAYHFARVSKDAADAIREADAFCEELLRWQSHWGLPPMLDIEWDKRSASIPAEKVVEWARTFVGTVEANLNTTCGIYTQHSFWLYRMKKDLRIAGRGNSIPETMDEQRPLWLASPVKNGTPTRPIPGWNPMIVQYTSKGIVPGIKGNVDMNYWWAKDEIPRSPSMMTALLLNFLAKFKTPERSDTP